MDKRNDIKYKKIIATLEKQNEIMQQTFIELQKHNKRLKKIEKKIDKKLKMEMI